MGIADISNIRLQAGNFKQQIPMFYVQRAYLFALQKSLCLNTYSIIYKHWKKNS